MRGVRVSTSSFINRGILVMRAPRAQDDARRGDGGDDGTAQSRSSVRQDACGCDTCDRCRDLNGAPHPVLVCGARNDSGGQAFMRLISCRVRALARDPPVASAAGFWAKPVCMHRHSTSCPRTGRLLLPSGTSPRSSLHLRHR